MSDSESDSEPKTTPIYVELAIFEFLSFNYLYESLIAILTKHPSYSQEREARTVGYH